MRVIGVTGGVGAGKSMILEILKKDYGARLLPADEIGRELMEPEGACFAPVTGAFGKAVVGADGRMNRGKLAEMVFGDKEALGRLNGIIHPAVRREIECRLHKWTEEEEKGADEKEHLAIIESAILLEAGYEDICGEIWYVYASEKTRIRRLMESRGYTRERCFHVMENQMGDAWFRNRASAVIDNDGDIESVREQIDVLIKKSRFEYI